MMKGLSTLTRTKGGICMLKNLKKVAAIVLSFAMAVQFGLADSYYVNAVEEPVEPQQQEETTTTCSRGRAACNRRSTTITTAC